MAFDSDRVKFFSEKIKINFRKNFLRTNQITTTLIILQLKCISNIIFTNMWKTFSKKYFYKKFFYFLNKFIQEKYFYNYKKLILKKRKNLHKNFCEDFFFLLPHIVVSVSELQHNCLCEWRRSPRYVGTLAISIDRCFKYTV